MLHLGQCDLLLVVSMYLCMYVFIGVLAKLTKKFVLHLGEQQPVMSTPVRAGTSVARHLEQFLPEKSDR